MTEREQLIPGPDHPITVLPSAAHVVVHSGDLVVADTAEPVVLMEANYPPVYYVPMADVDQSSLRPSETTTYCPYKGEASYFSVAGPEGELVDAVWCYTEPYPAVDAIAGYAAFYPDKVSITVDDQQP